jgi:hypothetical protein
MVETDDFLQNCSVLKSAICKPGGCCLFRVEINATVACLIVDLNFPLEISKIRVVMIEDRLMIRNLTAVGSGRLQ